MKQLQQLLEHVERTIDPDHWGRVDQRYIQALNCEAVDRPPLVFFCEQEHPLGLKPFSYREAFDDPAKMMFNQLLESVCPGLEYGDDSILQLRSDHGTIVIASMLGGHWRITEDMWPWVEAMEDIAQVEEIVAKGEPELNSELGARVIEFLEFYQEQLANYPKCRAGLRIIMPDLQGPFDTAHQLIGSDIFYMLCDRPDFIRDLLGLIARTMVAKARQIKALTPERLGPGWIGQHGYLVPGEILIRHDSLVNVSADMYRDIGRAYEAYVLDELGGGSIHFCGNAEHQIDALLEIESMKGVDLGQSYMMNIKEVYEKCLARKVAVVGIWVSAEEVVSGKAAEQYPTGAVLNCQVESIAEGRSIMAQCNEGTRKQR